MSGLKLAGAVAACLVSLPAAAQDTGWYLGGAVGHASYREACADFNAVAAPAAPFECTSKEHAAGKAFAGWRFHRMLAVELSYLDFGEAKGEGAAGGAPVNATTHVKAAGISALGFVPLGERFSVFGRLGIVNTRATSRASGAVAAEDERKEEEMHVGIGGLLKLSRGWALRLEFERVNDSKIDLTSFGAQYLF
jgi:OmpA-OmpF porin, OOP family